MAIFPDDIKDISTLDVQKQITTIYNYIKYMKEQLDFWSNNRIREILAIQSSIKSINENMESSKVKTKMLVSCTTNEYGNIGTGLYLNKGQILLSAATSSADNVILVPTIWANLGNEDIYGTWLVTVVDGTFTPIAYENCGNITLYYIEI